MTSVSAASGIVAQDMCKSFDDHLVLDKVSLAVEEGTILALLGPNGAGKTTMVRILSTLIPADSGSTRIAGHDVVTDPDGVRAVIGVTGQFSAVDNLLTGAENLRLMADLRHLGREAGRRRVAGLLEQFDLTDAAHKLLSTYSGGMRRRLDLAMTLVGKPRVIFLDEPTTGLDPRSRRTMWQIIRELATAGVTVLLTTQYLDEADQLADRIAVLDQGRIVAEGTPAELKSRIPGGRAPSCSRTRPGPARPPGPGRRHCRLAPGPARRAARSPYLRRTVDDPYPGPRRRVLRRHRQPRHRAAQRRPRTTRSTAVMTTLAYTLSDSRVMLRRNLKHQLRYPSMTVMLIGIPIVLLLLFVYVFGGQLGAGLGAHEGRSAYLNYVVPGLLLLTVASAIQGTSIMVAMDMTGGIIDRFRTMAIARASVLTGHVLGSLIQTLLAIAVLIAVAFGLGFRSAAGPLHWLAAIGILALFAFALIWLAVALGLAAKSVETASNTPMILFLLPFLSSGFVATATMPTGLRQFAEYQPFTPVADTVRGLLSGAAIGDHAIAAVAWSIGIAVVAYLWAIRLYNRRRAAEPK